MKKFLKLCLAVAALATMFGFASCSNDSSNDSTAPAATTATKKTVETKSITINGVTFTYTTTDGKVDTSSTVAVADDGTVTITGSDGTSKVTVSKDGKSLTYVSGGTTYTGDMTTVDKTTGGVTLKSEDGKTIEAKATSETKTVDTTPATTPAATANVFKGKTFASPENKIFFIFGSDGKVIFAQNKEKIFTETYTVTGNDFTFTVAGQNKISGSLSGTTLTAGDAEHGNGTFAQAAGTNGFGGKSFVSSDKTQVIVFVSDSKVVNLRAEKDKLEETYSVDNGRQKVSILRLQSQKKLLILMQMVKI